MISLYETANPHDKAGRTTARQIMQFVSFAVFVAIALLIFSSLVVWLDRRYVHQWLEENVDANLPVFSMKLKDGHDPSPYNLMREFSYTDQTSVFMAVVSAETASTAANWTFHADAFLAEVGVTPKQRIIQWTHVMAFMDKTLCGPGGRAGASVADGLRCRVHYTVSSNARVKTVSEGFMQHPGVGIVAYGACMTVFFAASILFSVLFRSVGVLVSSFLFTLGYFGITAFAEIQSWWHFFLASFMSLGFFFQHSFLVWTLRDLYFPGGMRIQRLLLGLYAMLLAVALGVWWHNYSNPLWALLEHIVLWYAVFMQVLLSFALTFATDYVEILIPRRVEEIRKEFLAQQERAEKQRLVPYDIFRVPMVSKVPTGYTAIPH